jgi:hypothetical protein
MFGFLSSLGLQQGFFPLALIPKPSAGFLSSSTHPMVFSRFTFSQISSLGLQQSSAPPALILRFSFQPGFILHRDSTGSFSSYTHPYAINWVLSFSKHLLSPTPITIGFQQSFISPRLRSSLRFSRVSTFLLVIIFSNYWPHEKSSRRVPFPSKTKVSLQQGFLTSPGSQQGFILFYGSLQQGCGYPKEFPI